MSTFRFSFPDTKRYNEAARKLKLFRRYCLKHREPAGTLTIREKIDLSYIRDGEELVAFFLALKPSLVSTIQHDEKPWIGETVGEMSNGESFEQPWITSIDPYKKKDHEEATTLNAARRNGQPRNSP